MHIQAQILDASCNAVNAPERKSPFLRLLRAFSLCLVLIWTALAADSGWRVDGRLILPGDSPARVLRLAGTPDYRERLESPEGGTLGNRWYYSFEGYNARTVILTFRGSRLVDIRTEHD